MEIPPELVAAKSDFQEELFALPGVNAVAIGMYEEKGRPYDELAIRVDVDDLSKVTDSMPTEIQGIPVCVIETTWQPLGIPDSAFYAELRGGIKVSSPLVASGTMGAVVKDLTGGEGLLGLSCLHVVGFPDTAHDVWQPDVQFPPLTSDVLGSVARVDNPQPVPTVPPQVLMSTDSAVFRLSGPPFGSARPKSAAIAGAGVGLADMVPAVTATADPLQGQEVRKRGFETGITPPAGTPTANYPQVIAFHKDMDWTVFGGGVRLLDQVEIWSIQAGSFAQPGDSGSLVLGRNSSTAVGLLVGANPAGGRAVMTPIKRVESRLGVSVAWGP